MMLLRRKTTTHNLLPPLLQFLVALRTSFGLRKRILNVCVADLDLLFSKQSWSGQFLLQNKRHDQCAGVTIHDAFASQTTTHNLLAPLFRFLVVLHASFCLRKKEFRTFAWKPLISSFRNSLGLGHSYSRTKGTINVLE